MPEEIISSSNKTELENPEKESLGQIIKKSFPKQLIPTKRIGTILGLIFLGVLIIAGMQFPFGQMLSGNLEITINIGYPWHFLEFSLLDTEKFPLLILNLFLDLFVYIIIAYVIDIILNLIIKNPVSEAEETEEKLVAPKTQKPTIAEKVAEKVTEKTK